MNFMEWMKSVKSDVWCPPILRIDEFHEIDEIDEVRGRLCFQSKIKVKNENRTMSNNVKISPQKYVYQGSPIMPLKKKTKTKRQNRSSEIRLSGVPPIIPIKKKCQNRPSEIRLSGVPTIMPIKNKVKIDPQKYVY